jgi:lysophospholipase L1-like esterase
LTAGFWLLALCSLPAALWVRLTAPRLDEASGEPCGITGQGSTLRMLALGDSIIAGVGIETVESSLPVLLAGELAAKGHQVHWRLHGENGADIADLCDLLDTLAVHNPPDFLLISVGVNDVTGLTSLRSWRVRLEQMFDMIVLKFPDVRIIFAGLPPMDRFPVLPQPLRTALGMRARMLDTIACDVVSNVSGAIHVPTRVDPEFMSFCEDGFHPDTASCKIWAEQLALLLLEAPPAQQQGENH